ncbi:unnamed protein product [Citrullus colocynthis]|uniref:Uncharacterized protein n=1 Tax=Citrullus colocynthis TaxID=252529 RepID=A0ABP0XR37_9ROSI
MTCVVSTLIRIALVCFNGSNLVRLLETRNWQKWERRSKKVKEQRVRWQSEEEIEEGAPTGEHMVRKEKRRVGGKSTDHRRTNEQRWANGKTVATQRCRGWLAEMEREDVGDSLDGMAKRSKVGDAEETTRTSKVANDESENTTWMGLNNDEYLRCWIRKKRRCRVGPTTKGKVADDECNLAINDKGSRDERRGI